MTRQVSIFFSSFFLLVLPLTSSLPSFSYILDPEKSISASLITFCIDSFFLFSSSLSLLYIVVACCFFFRLYINSIPRRIKGEDSERRGEEVERKEIERFAEPYFQDRQTNGQAGRQADSWLPLSRSLITSDIHFGRWVVCAVCAYP